MDLADFRKDLADSWKDYSALAFIAKSSVSQLSRIILEILLLAGADPSLSDIAMGDANTEVLLILMNWECRGREAGESLF